MEFRPPSYRIEIFKEETSIKPYVKTHLHTVQGGRGTERDVGTGCVQLSEQCGPELEWEAKSKQSLREGNEKRFCTG